MDQNDLLAIVAGFAVGVGIGALLRKQQTPTELRRSKTLTNPKELNCIARYNHSLLRISAASGKMLDWWKTFLLSHNIDPNNDILLMKIFGLIKLCDSNLNSVDVSALSVIDAQIDSIINKTNSVSLGELFRSGSKENKIYDDYIFIFNSFRSELKEFNC